MAKVKKSGIGSMSGLKASDKRVGPVDPNGAWTKVQEATLALWKRKIQKHEGPGDRAIALS